MARRGQHIQVLIIFALVGALFLVVLAVRREAREAPPEREQDGWETAEPRMQEREQGGEETAKSPAQTEAESEKADSSDLLRKAEREGSVRVIVGLQVDFVPEGKLSRSQAADQRDAIRMAQTRLLADLQGTGFQILREYDSAPFIALKLTPRALEAVQRSPRVTSIMEDRPEQAALAESAPLVQAPSMWSNGYTGEGQIIAALEGLRARGNSQSLGDGGRSE